MKADSETSFLQSYFPRQQYLIPAWLGCLHWAIGQEDCLEAFRREAGNTWTPGRTPLDRMRTTKHKVSLTYTPTELRKLFETANREDVDKGGRYDARSAAINVWSHRWDNPATKHDSETIGTFYFDWTQNHIDMIETDFGFSKDDLLAELATLEKKALGQVKYGRDAPRGLER